MLRSFEQLQYGLMSTKSFQSSVTLNRVYDLQPTTDTILTSWHSSGISAIDLERVEERYLLTGAKNGGLAIHDLLNTSGHVSYNSEVVGFVNSNTRYAHKYCICTVQWYPFDTGMFITSSVDNKLKIWDTNRLKPVETVRMQEKIINHHMSSISTQHSFIAVAMTAPSVILVDLRSGISCQQLCGHRKGVSSVKWSPFDEFLLASGGEDGKIFLWDVRSGKGYLKALDQHNGEAIGSRKDLLTAHDRTVNSLCFTDDGLYLVSYGNEGRIRLWDVALHKNTLVNFGVSAPQPTRIPLVMDLCSNVSHPALFIPCGRCVCVYDLLTGTKVKNLVGHLDFITGCAFKPSTQNLYSCGQDKNILVWTPDMNLEMQEQEDPNKRGNRRTEWHMEMEEDEWSDSN